MNRRVLLVPILALAIVASACSDDSPPPSVASLETESTNISPAEADSDPLADCMRGNGVDMPDPDFSSGMIDLGGARTATSKAPTPRADTIS